MFYTLIIPFVYALQCRTGKIKMSGSELRPRKVELTSMHSKYVTTTKSILHITTNPVFVPTKTSLMAVIFIN